MPSPVQMSALGTGFERPPHAARGHDHRLGFHHVQLSRAHLLRHTAAASPVLHDEGGGEELIVGGYLVFQDLLVACVEHGLTGDVGDEVGTRIGGAPEGSGPQPAFFISVEDDAHVLQLDDVAGGLLAQDLDGVLIAQVVAALHGIEGVGLPGVPFREGGVDAALGGVGVAAHGVDFGEHRYVCARALGLDGRPQARHPRPDYQYIVLKDHLWPLSLPQPRKSRQGQQAA